MSIQGLTGQPPGAGNHPQPDRHTHGGVDPGPSGRPHDQGSHDHPDRADGVGQHLEVGALDVDRLLGAVAQEGEGHQVGHQAEHRRHQHRTAVDLRSIAEAADRLHHHVPGHPEQQHRVGQRGEDLQSVQAEGTARPSGSLARSVAVGQPDGGQGHAQAGHVGHHVPGVGEQGQRSRGQADHQFDHHEHEQDGERRRQPASVSCPRPCQSVGVGVPV